MAIENHEIYEANINEITTNESLIDAQKIAQLTKLVPEIEHDIKKSKHKKDAIRLHLLKCDIYIQCRLLEADPKIQLKYITNEINSLEDILKLDKEHNGATSSLSQALHLRASVKERENDFAGAIEDYTLFIGYFEGEQRAEPLRHRAIAKKQLGDLQGALDDLEKAEQYTKGNYKIYKEFGRTYHKLERLEESADAYDKAYSLNRNDPEVLKERGIIHAKLVANEKALELEKKIGLQFSKIEGKLASVTNENDLIDLYQTAISRDEERLKSFEAQEKKLIEKLGICLRLIWFIIFALLGVFAVGNEIVISPLLFIGITASASGIAILLNYDRFSNLRQNRRNQQITKLEYEDHKRKRDLLLLRMIDGDETARRDRTSKAFDHFADNSTVEVLERNFQPKYFAKNQRLKQADEAERYNLEQLLKRLIDAIKGQS